MEGYILQAALSIHSPLILVNDRTTLCYTKMRALVLNLWIFGWVNGWVLGGGWAMYLHISVGAGVVGTTLYGSGNLVVWFCHHTCSDAWEHVKVWSMVTRVSVGFWCWTCEDVIFFCSADMLNCCVFDSVSAPLCLHLNLHCLAIAMSRSEVYLRHTCAPYTC